MALSDKNLVSDTFWLNLGAEQVYNSIQSRSAAVERLQKTIVWVFSVYTSITIAGIVFSKENWNTYSLLLFGLAFLFLIVAYWAATNASFSSPESFFAADPKSVQAAFNDAIKKGNRHFRLAVILSSIGVIFYSLALFLLFAFSTILSFSKSSPNCTLVDSLEVAVTKNAGESQSFAVQINSKKNSWVLLIVLKDSTTTTGSLIHDTVQVITPVQPQSFMQVFVDSTKKTSFNLRLKGPYRKGEYFVVQRTDSLDQGATVKMISKIIKL